MTVDTPPSSVTSALYSLTVEIGADFVQSFRIRNGQVRALVPLEEWIFKAQIRLAPNGAVIADFDTTLSDDGLTLTLSIPWDVTSELAPQSAAHWDLLAIRPDGIRARLLEGRVSITDRITIYA